MKEAIVILTLMGCDHGEANCQFIETASQTYRSEIECLNNSEGHILDVADQEYPIILADCSIQSHSVPQSEVADLLDGELHEPLLTLEENPEEQVATNRSPRRPLANSVGAIRNFGGNMLNTAWQATVKTTSAINPF